jgi:hypothetical protein
MSVWRTKAEEGVFARHRQEAYLRKRRGSGHGSSHGGAMLSFLVRQQLIPGLYEQHLGVHSESSFPVPVGAWTQGDRDRNEGRIYWVSIISR